MHINTQCDSSMLDLVYDDMYVFVYISYVCISVGIRSVPACLVHDDVYVFIWMCIHVHTYKYAHVHAYEYTTYTHTYIS